MWMVGDVPAISSGNGIVGVLSTVGDDAADRPLSSASSLEAVTTPPLNRILLIGWSLMHCCMTCRMAVAIVAQARESS